ncbi:hypothetical protein Acr_13g0000130 [Actinidia rufa]|uniref:Retrotransposon Copia-like N-terminal domain-containing protein n=1 Tax=Actinidia rufa TaxID=165716 RepID=A0A7J0FIU6_9ERIC|nr:hypothetical protein Acr_13g0000130 [Actinidia rufa]
MGFVSARFTGSRSSEKPYHRLQLQLLQGFMFNEPSLPDKPPEAFFPPRLTLRQLENVPLDICGIKLDGTNYLIWSRTFTLAIEARGMSEFIEEHGFQAVCTVNAASWLKRLEKERVYDFLACLDVEYDQIRVQVLGRVPFPSLGEGVSYRLALVMGLTIVSHSSVITARTPTIPGISVGSYMAVLLVGEGVNAVVVVEVGGFSQGEMQALRRLMAQADSSPTITPTSTSSYFAHTDISANAFTVSSSVPWIIDSGASDHMTGCDKDKELKTGKVIGNGKAHGGLYFLESPPHSPMSCGLALQADKGQLVLVLHNVAERKNRHLAEGKHRQEEEIFSGEGEKLFYDHGDRSKEKSGEEPIYPVKATRDKEASPHRLQGSNLKTYTRREKGKSSCVIPPCQLQSPASVPDSPADSSGNDSSSIEPSLVNSVDLSIALQKGVRSCTQHPI